MRSTELNDKMEFDHVVTVLPGGEVTDGPEGVHAPESLIDTDDNGQISADDERAWRESIERAGWQTFTEGYSGQYLYSGAIMHASEYIGGGLERDILASPGLYVVVMVECLPLDDPDDDARQDSAGWAVLRRELPHVAYPHHPGYLIGCTACEAACHCTGDATSANCVASEHDNPNQPDEILDEKS